MMIPEPKFAATEMPWARAMQAQLETLQGAVDRSDQNGLNTNKGQNATLQSLGETVQILQGQVAAIQALLANQVSPAVDSDSATGFTLTTSYKNLAAFTMVAPAGYSRAVVIASGTVGADTGSTSGDRLTVRFTINGTAGQETVVVSPTTNPFPSATAFQSIVITGLSTGDHVTATLQGHLQIGPGATLLPNNAVAAGMAIFLP